MRLSNMRINRKTGNQRNWAGWTKHGGTGNETDGAGRTSERPTTKQETERNERKKCSSYATNRTETLNERRTTKRETKRMERKYWTTVSRRGGKTDGLNGSVERMARNEMGRRERTGGKPASNDREGGEVLC